MTDQATGSAAAGNPAATTAEVVAPAGSTSAAVAAAPPVVSIPNAAGPEWLAGADELKVGYVQNKGWKDPAQVVDSYINLEKLLGAEKAGRTVVLPGEKAEAAELDAFYTKLGRPAEAKDYKIAVPEGVPTDYAESAKAKFHELGISAKQAEALAAWNNEQAAAMSAKQQNQSAEAFNADVSTIKTEWGAAHDQNLVIARNAAAALGWDGAKIDKVSGALGHAETMRLLHQIGSKTGESDFVGGQGTSFGNAKTPAQAKAEIQALKQDRGFTAKLMNKDAEANARWTQLHQYAFPQS
jgi:hypothetical protein